MSEVCSVVDVSQFAEVGTSLDKCGFYSVSLLFHAGKTGQAPPFNGSDVASWADGEYGAYDGADVASNANGMTMGTLEAVLHDAGLHYQVVGSGELGYHTERMTAEYIRAWLELGYPVVLAVAEDNVYDLDLGGSPYAWDTSGLYHIITATGIDGDAILCHDTASIAPDGVRPGPRRYDASKLQAGLTSATAVVMSWLQRPQGDYDPIASGGHMIPNGWHDDGAKLTAPNGHYLMHGFRQHVIDAPVWDAADMPLEEEQSVPQVELHASSGAGTRQLTVGRLLIYTAAKGVKESAAGQEIKACYDEIAVQAKQITALQAQLKAAQTPIVPPSINVTAAVAAAMLLVDNQASADKVLATLKTALGIS